jgi:hypothetical protein
MSKQWGPPPSDVRSGSDEADKRKREQEEAASERRQQEWDQALEEGKVPNKTMMTRDESGDLLTNNTENEVPNPTEDHVQEGIYEFPDKKEKGKTYVGQSSKVPKRLKQHEASGKKDKDDEAKVTEVKGGKTSREIKEQQRINELGGTKDKEGSQTSNVRNPIGKKRTEEIEKKYGSFTPPTKY